MESSLWERELCDDCVKGKIGDERVAPCSSRVAVLAKGAASVCAGSEESTEHAKKWVLIFTLSSGELLLMWLSAV